MVQQLQQAVQQLQNPLASAARITAEGKITETERKRELDVAEMLEESRQFNVETAQNQDQFNKKLAAQLTELELKFNKDVPGSNV